LRHGPAPFGFLAEPAAVATPARRAGRWEPDRAI